MGTSQAMLRGPIHTVKLEMNPVYVTVLCKRRTESGMSKKVLPTPVRRTAARAPAS
jgi:hypothetical protein